MLSLFHKIFPALGLLLWLSPASAVSVSYNTTGSAFTCAGPGSGTNASPTCSAAGSSVTFTSGTNTATLTYAAVNPNSVVDADPITNAQFGTFSLSGNSTVFLGALNYNLADFTLAINQALPSIGSGTTTGDLLGRIRIVPSTSGLSIDFTNGANVTIGGVVYSPFDVQINAFDLPTTLQGTVDASAVPEPGFYGLLSVGLAGLFMAGWKRAAATNKK
jgi:hypothetical protein